MWSCTHCPWCMGWSPCTSLSCAPRWNFPTPPSLWECISTWIDQYAPYPAQARTDPSHGGIYKIPLWSLLWGLCSILLDIILINIRYLDVYTIFLSHLYDGLGLTQCCIKLSTISSKGLVYWVVSVTVTARPSIKHEDVFTPQVTMIIARQIVMKIIYILGSAAWITVSPLVHYGWFIYIASGVAPPFLMIFSK